ncbi:MAG: 16S rRNA (cytidine(1402)-2'-O)-methyltransferase, partial [Desulfovibrionaceae bacterium]|nr:16S rRNA (cytidine(1402)-2'-O)-methyltransferase [Desulfovibrionaceae bacterium]
MSESLGCLWVVATPIGNLSDLSPRAKAILEEVEVILCEDTRRSQHLMTALQISPKKLISFHEHNEAQREPWVLAELQKGQDLALISDAGTPLMADPGYRLVRACRKQGIKVSPIPGPSAP